MSDEKEVKLVVPKSLMVVLWVAAIGLLLNRVQPFLSSPANAVGGVQKIAICDANGQGCASVYNSKLVSFQADHSGLKIHAERQ